MESPSARDGDKRSIVVTISFHLNRVHLKRNQRRRIAPSIHMRLVARDVGVVHDPRIVDHRVNHRRRRAIHGGRPGHRRRRLRRRHRPVLPEVYALGELEPVVNRFRKFLRHHRRALGCEEKSAEEAKYLYAFGV
ncbi:hypothetical protein CR513_50983, partial [Mucuna pruriens]